MGVCEPLSSTEVRGGASALKLSMRPDLSATLSLPSPGPHLLQPPGKYVFSLDCGCGHQQEALRAAPPLACPLGMSGTGMGGLSSDKTVRGNDHLTVCSTEKHLEKRLRGPMDNIWHTGCEKLPTSVPLLSTHGRSPLSWGGASLKHLCKPGLNQLSRKMDSGQGSSFLWTCWTLNKVNSLSPWVW